MCCMAKSFLPYSLDQQILLPQDMREWLPENHLAHFILDLVDELDLDAILSVCRAKTDRGRAAYHPKMMVSLLIYAYCMGKPSSRKIERATYEDVAYRVRTTTRFRTSDSSICRRCQVSSFRCCCCANKPVWSSWDTSPWMAPR